MSREGRILIFILAWFPRCAQDDALSGPGVEHENIC
jgi:hypothetical protein